MLHREFDLPTADGRRLHAQAWEPLVPAAGFVGIVHGLGEHSGRYAACAAQFVESGFAVFAYDQRGHGRSPGQRGHARSYDVLLDDLGAFLRLVTEASRGRPVFLWGHSFGGALTLNLALRHDPPLSGLVVTGPLLQLAKPPAPGLVRVVRLLNRVLPRLTLRLGLHGRDMTRDEAVARQYDRDPLVHGRVSARLAVQMIEAGEWALGHAPDLRLPLLLMHGGADPVTSVAASERFAREANPPGQLKMKVWEGLRHELHWEREREQVLGFAIDWLQARLESHDAGKEFSR